MSYGCLLRVAKYIGEFLWDNHKEHLLYVDDCLIIAMMQVSLIILEVLKDILDANSVLKLHSLLPFRDRS